MIFNVITGTKRKAAVTVYGAPSETVTITDGTDTYTVATNANGVGTTTPEVKFGTYTVTGSVSAGALPSGRTVTVDRHTAVITAYPDGALFWFGNGDASGDSLYSRCGGWSAVRGAYASGHGSGAAGTNQSSSDSGTGRGTAAGHDGSSTLVGIASQSNTLIDYSGYTKLRVYCDSYVENSGESGIAVSAGTASAAFTAQAYQSLGNASAAVRDLTLSGASGYFIAVATSARYYKPYGSTSYLSCTASNHVYALWRE